MKTNFKIFAALLVLSVSLHAQDAQLEQKFKNELEGKVLLLRDFASDKEIAVSGDGKLLHAVHPGIWPLGYMEVKKTKISKGKILLNGERVGLRYDDAKKKLVAIRTKQDVAISVSGPFDGSPDQIVQRVKETVFTSEGSQTSTLPEYWREYYLGNVNLGKISPPPAAGASPPPTVTPQVIEGEELYYCGREPLKPPRPVKSPDPQYSEAARALNYQGTNVFTVIVAKSGSISRIFIKRPLGLGLDEQAVAKLETWEFVPGSRNGKPVNCIINVEINFRLY